MGSCTSKHSPVESQRHHTAPIDSAASLTCNRQSNDSQDGASTGSQLRTAAKPAWQTSARNLRASGSHNSGGLQRTTSPSLEDDGEIDSAGGGGRPGRGRCKAHNASSPSSASSATTTTTTSLPKPLLATATSGAAAWEAETPGSAGSLTGTSTLVAALSAAGATRGRSATAAANAAMAHDSCVQSFHVPCSPNISLPSAAGGEESDEDVTAAVALVNAAAAATTAGAGGKSKEPGSRLSGSACPNRGKGEPASGGDTNTNNTNSSSNSSNLPPALSPAGAVVGSAWGPPAEVAAVPPPGIRAPCTSSSPPAHDPTLAVADAAAIATSATAAAPAEAAKEAPPTPAQQSVGEASGTASASATATGHSAADAVAIAAAAAAAAVGAASGGKANGGAPVQWVIRPGPPVESVYKLGEVLGKGSFGVVRSATHLESGARVAVKTIRKSLLRASDVSALRREVEILHHLSGHPAISQLLGVFEEPRQLHLVLELYQGGDLFDAIIARGRHSERAAADVMRTVLTAIAYCHAMGVAHRDIKPENFMLTTPPHPPGGDPKGPKTEEWESPEPAEEEEEDGLGMGARLKLIDFGLSVFCNDSRPLTDTVGTSYYVAPEVLGRRYNRSADVWSAGVIMHILLTGYAPFDGRNDQEILRAVQMGKLDMCTDPIWTSISRDARTLLSAMLNRDPASRATAEQLLAMPWLGRTRAACTAPTAPLPGVVSDRMRRFARMNSFKKEARRVVAGLLASEEVAGLVAAFRGLDADGDGKLDTNELRDGLARQELRNRGATEEGAAEGPGGAGTPFAGLREEELRELVDRSDLNGDGLLDESEFLAAALPTSTLARQAHLDATSRAHSPPSGSTQPEVTGGFGGGGGGGAPPPASSSPLAAAFAHFDTDGSGFITEDELRKALAGHRTASGGGQGTDVKALISAADADADGRISYPEFVAMMVTEVDWEEELAVDAQRRAAVAGRAAGGNGEGGQEGGGKSSTGAGMPPAPRAGAGSGGGGVGVQGVVVPRSSQPQMGAAASAVANSSGGGGQGSGGGGQGGGGKSLSPHRPPRVTHDEDMVPYEQLPNEDCKAAGGGAGRGGGGRGGNKCRRGPSTAAWGVVPAVIAAGNRARRGKNDGGASRSTATSFRSTATIHSHSEGGSVLDWCDECTREEEYEDEGEDAANGMYDTSCRRDDAVTGYGAPYYEPSRFSQVAVGGPTLIPAARGCSGGGGVGGGAYPALHSVKPANRPPALLIPTPQLPLQHHLQQQSQPVGIRRARRHSAAEVMNGGVRLNDGVTAAVASTVRVGRLVEAAAAVTTAAGESPQYPGPHNRSNPVPVPPVYSPLGGISVPIPSSLRASYGGAGVGVSGGGGTLSPGDGGMAPPAAVFYSPSSSSRVPPLRLDLAPTAAAAAAGTQRHQTRWVQGGGGGGGRTGPGALPQLSLASPAPLDGAGNGVPFGAGGSLAAGGRGGRHPHGHSHHKSIDGEYYC